MKNKALILTALIFFLLINTTYYWEPWLGAWSMLSFLILIGVFLFLAIALGIQIFQAIKERSLRTNRMFTIAPILLILVLTFLRPGGLVDFEKFESRDLLIAKREGVANCMFTLKLKANNKFVESRVCFGVYSIRGKYSVKGDTIFFLNPSLSRGVEDYFDFAVVKKSYPSNGQVINDLVRFENLKDTIGNPLSIVYNNLTKK